MLKYLFNHLALGIYFELVSIMFTFSFQGFTPSS